MKKRLDNISFKLCNKKTIQVGGCGYLGPRPNPHSRPNWSKDLEGKRPNPQLPHEYLTNPQSGYFKGIKPIH